MASIKTLKKVKNYFSYFLVVSCVRVSFEFCSLVTEFVVFTITLFQKSYCIFSSPGLQSLLDFSVSRHLTEEQMKVGTQTHIPKAKQQ